MKTVSETLRDTNLDTMARLVMEDPCHRARVQVKTEQARKCYQTRAERQLEAVKAQREKDRKAFQARATRMVLDHNATTATIAAGALFIGYILALL